MSIKAGKIYASLMAGALGDALGYAVEFIPYSSIVHRYGKDGIRELQPVNGKAIISDDTQMTLFTNDAMLRASGSDTPAPVLVYRAYLLWLKTQRGVPGDPSVPEERLNCIPELNHPRAPGNTCLRALGSGKMGTLTEPINNSKGCGGVMRTAPLGFYPQSFGSPLINGAKCAAITHGHPMGWVPAGMLSDIVSKAIYGEYASLYELISASLDDTRAEFGDEKGFAEFEAMIRSAMELSASDLEDEPAIRSLGGGWVGDEALAIAVYSCLKHPDGIKDCLISAVNHSGDSDSTGAIAGNILGAWLGAEALPEDWIEKLELTELIYEQARLAAEAAGVN